MRYVLTPSNTLVVRGPSAVRVLEGSASILGATIRPKERIVVANQKQLPIEAQSEVVLQIITEGPAEFFGIEGSTIPTSWKEAAEALLDMREGRVMIIGATDVGKSTLCVFLVNRLLAYGLDVRVVDADIGQTDLGPPTTIGSALPKAQTTSLSDLTPSAMLFIGNTSPNRVESKLVAGIQRLSADLAGGLTVINTDGWVLDPEAILFKMKLIDSLKPDLVFGLAKGNELQPILSSSRARSMNVEAAKQVLVRSRRNRREIRTAGYRRALRGARTRSIPLAGLEVSIPNELPALRGPRAQELNDMIVGLIAENGYLIQIGIFRGIEGERIQIYCRETVSLRRMEFGYVRLTPSGREIGYLAP